MSNLDPWLSFLAGVAGSMHCVGMCGPLVLAYTTQSLTRRTPWASTGFHLAYNAGRVLSYTLLGAFLGAVGGSIGGLRGVGTWFSLGMGALVMAGGIYQLRSWFPGNIETENTPTPEDGSGGWTNKARLLLGNVYRRSFGALVATPGMESKFYIGLLTPLLPCGLLYGMFLRAAGSSGALEGGLMLGLFGLGIVPALLITGYASSVFGTTLRVWGDRVAAVTLILMGASLIWRGWMAGVMGGGGH